MGLNDLCGAGSSTSVTAGHQQNVLAKVRAGDAVYGSTDRKCHAVVEGDTPCCHVAVSVQQAVNQRRNKSDTVDVFTSQNTEVGRAHELLERRTPIPTMVPDTSVHLREQHSEGRDVQHKNAPWRKPVMKVA